MNSKKINKHTQQPNKQAHNTTKRKWPSKYSQPISPMPKYKLMILQILIAQFHTPKTHDSKSLDNRSCPIASSALVESKNRDRLPPKNIANEIADSN